VLYSDRTRPCVDAATKAARSLVNRAAATKTDQCVINYFGAETTTAGFTMYISSVAVFVQAMTLVSFSAVADHGRPAALPFQETCTDDDQVTTERDCFYSSACSVQLRP
jgi:hypothetical protein